MVYIHMVYIHVVVQGRTVHMLDLAAKVDSTAEYLCKKEWGDIDFPPSFGRQALPEVTQDHTSYM